MPASSGSGTVTVRGAHGRQGMRAYWHPLPETTAQLSHVWPTGSRITEQGRLEIGGCDTVELAREFGTPAYVVAEDDLRGRARAFSAAFASRAPDSELLFASKAFPCTAVYRVLAEEGIGCDVASGGELRQRAEARASTLRGSCVHGNAKSAAELRMALDAQVGHDRRSTTPTSSIASTAWSTRPQRVYLRVTPNVRGETHDVISTGQADSKFGFELADAPRG